MWDWHGSTHCSKSPHLHAGFQRAGPRQCTVSLSLTSLSSQVFWGAPLQVIFLVLFANTKLVWKNLWRVMTLAALASLSVTEKKVFIILTPDRWWLWRHWQRLWRQWLGQDERGRTDTSRSPGDRAMPLGLRLSSGGLYYKHIAIVFGESRVVSKWCSKLWHHIWS